MLVLFIILGVIVLLVLTVVIWAISYKKTHSQPVEPNASFKQEALPDANLVKAWIEFEKKAKKIVDFSKENQKTNVDLINEVANKIGLNENEVRLLHQIRMRRNQIVHEGKGSLKDELTSYQQVQLAKILAKMNV